MNQKLQNILDIIQQSEKLDAEQKENLLKAVKDADKELEITAFKLERTEKVKKTTAILLEETIEELEQKRKAVEDQNRELEIEASLERVRAVAMGMNKSEDLLSICEVSFKEFQKLGFDNIRNALIHIQYDEQKYFMDYDFSDLTDGAITKIEYGSHPVVEDYLKQINSAKDAFYEGVIKEDQLKEWKDFRKKSGQKDDPRLENATALYYYFFSIGIGDIGISTLQPIDESQVKILKRFRNVFDLAYRRYTDISQAEALAREAQIEASLERVRARSMAMHESQELREIIACVFEELQKLDFVAPACSLIFYKEDQSAEHWFAGFSEGAYPQSYTIPYIDIPYYTDLLKAWQDGSGYEEFIMEGQAKVDYAKWLLSETDFRNLPKEFVEGSGMQTPTPLFFSDAYNKYGMLEVIGNESLPKDKVNIVKRMSNVFEQTYTRFLDLQKAEEQAREAQIEAALERVRSKAMAMHSSDDLADTVEVLYKELDTLQVHALRFGHAKVNSVTKTVELHTATDLGKVVGHVKLEGHPLLEKIYEHVLTKEDLHYTLQGEEMKSYYSILSSAIEVPIPPEGTIQYGYFFFLGDTANYAWSDRALNEEELKVYGRLITVLNLTYKRYEELKNSEAQAREAQIEAALERVRSRTMGMQKSEELKEVIQLVYEQFVHLNIHIEHTGFILDYKTRDDLHIWLADQNEMPSEITIPCFDSPPNNSIKVAKEKEESFFAYLLTFEEKNKFYQELFKFIPGVPQESLDYYFNCPGLAGSGILLENIGLYIENFSGTPYTDEENAVLMRFGKVFQQTYTRFLDLQKAEAQAREAQIEAALERVRSLALGMRKSEEVGNVTDSFFNEFNKLSVDVIGCSIVVIDENKDTMELWRARSNVAVKPFESSSFNKLMNILKKYMPEWFPKFYNALGERNKYLIEEMSTKNRDQFLNAIAEQYDYSNDEKLKLLEITPKGFFANFVFFKLGYLALMTEVELSNEELSLARRFMEVFDFAYTRFLDITKAEAQAREAEIEAALERVRSRTMAMQKSNELAETASHLFGQLNVLGIKPYRFNIAIVNTESEKCQLWSTTNEGKIIPAGPLIPLKEYNVFNQMYDGWKQQQSVSVIRIEGEERVEWTKYIMKYVSFNEYKPENVDLERLKTEPAIFSNFFFKQGFIVVHTIEEIFEADIKIIQRFVNVFEQTYTRFLDLQKAEAQAREAKIEASLEKVRTVALTMKRSDEMLDIAQALYEQLLELGFTNIRNAIIDLHDDKNETFLDYDYSHDMGRTVTLMTYHDHPIIEEQVRQIQSSSDAFFELTLEGQDLQDLIDIRLKNGEEEDPRLGNINQLTYNLYSFGEGAIGISNFGLLSEEQKIVLKRFRNVFAFAYKRYSDMVQAEKQAKEVVKQAALDRIRGEIASMRTSEDLNRITPIIWRELKTLEVPFIRCGVFIVDETQEKVQVYLTTPDGKSLGVLNLSFDANQLTTNTVDYWRKKQVYREHWDQKEFIDWTKSMMKLGQIESAETYQGSTTPPESLYLHFVPFAQGMLYVGDANPLKDEKLDLVRTLAEAFSIAYARYEDFKHLEDAKNKIEFTLHELKAAQAQLVHSEKMASLGELTAGIAHEIKNPLNFVNNFSEVSRELLDEMKTELKNKNEEEVAELIEDLKQNLEKIAQHGKRADSIVKGMLLHSRGTSGEKTLTDINDLLDQYVNLAYHGMRATNKEFNITIEKDYDKSLEKINVVPQDLSRVFLNIINNACYTAYDKKKIVNDDNFSPTLSVSTKNLNGKIEIKIADNGNGIPKDIIDKIFQPFFTTKPTGEGTGLGLSLSYDIITKVHSGELKVETEEGVGTEFTIILNK
jgi:signal transduction histidine kinase